MDHTQANSKILPLPDFRSTYTFVKYSNWLPDCTLFLSFSHHANRILFRDIKFLFKDPLKLSRNPTVLNNTFTRITNRIYPPPPSLSLFRIEQPFLLGLSGLQILERKVMVIWYHVTHSGWATRGEGCQLQPIIFMTGSIISFVTVSVWRRKERLLTSLIV